MQCLLSWGQQSLRIARASEINQIMGAFGRAQNLPVRNWRGRVIG